MKENGSTQVEGKWDGISCLQPPCCSMSTCRRSSTVATSWRPVKFRLDNVIEHTTQISVDQVSASMKTGSHLVPTSQVFLLQPQTTVPI